MDALQLFPGKHRWVSLKMRTEERQYRPDLTSQGGGEFRPRITQRNVNAAEGPQNCQENLATGKVASGRGAVKQRDT